MIFSARFVRTSGPSRFCGVYLVPPFVEILIFPSAPFVCTKEDRPDFVAFIKYRTICTYKFTTRGPSRLFYCYQYSEKLITRSKSGIEKFQITSDYFILLLFVLDLLSFLLLHCDSGSVRLRRQNFHCEFRVLVDHGKSFDFHYLA